MAKAKKFVPPKPLAGVKWDGPKVYAFCNGVKWDIKPLAAAKSSVDAIMDFYSDHQKRMIDLGPNPVMHEVHKISVDTTRAVLELALVNFKYDEAACNPETPPGLLAALSNEMRDFLAAGGALGMQHLQTQHNMARQIS